MKFAVVLDHQYERDADLGARLGELVELVQHIRDLDFDGVFGVHHYLSSLRTPQPLPLLSRLIDHTGRMDLGTGVLILTMGHPVHWAEEVATIDQMSGGRVVLGVGSGYREDEFKSFGLEQRTRVSRMNESIEVMLKLWSGEPVTHHGKHFDLDDVRCSVLPARDPHPPIWVGANGPIGIERIARQGLPWFAPSNVRRNWAVGNLNDFRRYRAEEGFDDTGAVFPIQRDLCVADSFEDAYEFAGEQVRRSYGEYVQYGMDYFDSQWDGIKHKALFFGSADEVSEKIQDFADAGYNYFVFRVQWLGLPIEKSMEILDRFAKEVMPRFR